MFRKTQFHIPLCECLYGCDKMLLSARISFISAYSYLLYDSVWINISLYGQSIIWWCVDQYQSIWSVYYMMMCGSISVHMVCLLY